ncbi:MAG: hypothetical protein MRY83_20690 [Flavobacteriales bacterium]|nr:hypothetical protein [Flavobacteriales bacterium]
MRSLKYKQLLLIGIALVACVGMTFFRSKPIVDKTKLGVHAKLDKAINLVQNGQNPMEGITLLKEVLSEDSTNVQALYYLGVFSVQSGQLDKAIGRFESIVKIDSNHFEANYYLSNLYFEMGDSLKAAYFNEKVKRQVDSNK